MLTMLSVTSKFVIAFVNLAVTRFLFSLLILAIAGSISASNVTGEKFLLVQGNLKFRP